MVEYSFNVSCVFLKKKKKKKQTSIQGTCVSIWRQLKLTKSNCENLPAISKGCLIVDSFRTD